MSSTSARPSRICTGTPTAWAPEGTTLPGGTSAPAPTSEPASVPGKVADHAARADPGRVLIPGVHDDAVLDRRPLPYQDVAVVAPQHRPGPHGGQGADLDVADDHRGGVHEGVGVDARHQLAQRVDRHVR